MCNVPKGDIKKHKMWFLPLEKFTVKRRLYLSPPSRQIPILPWSRNYRPSECLDWTLVNLAWKSRGEKILCSVTNRPGVQLCALVAIQKKRLHLSLINFSYETVAPPPNCQEIEWTINVQSPVLFFYPSNEMLSIYVSCLYICHEATSVE